MSKDKELLVMDEATLAQIEWLGFLAERAHYNCLVDDLFGRKGNQFQEINRASGKQPEAINLT